MKPLCVDLFCGLGGWAEGFLAAGYRVVGFDNHRHRYPRIAGEPEGGVKRPGRNWSGSHRPGYKAVAFNSTGHISVMDGEWMEYPGQLVIQDVLTLHGSQFRNAAVIVASPPCQAYSYMAMPWSLAKAKAAAIRADETGVKRADLTALFDACFRIQREACEAAGRYIPLIVENVKGAQPWVGRAPWNFGSFYLWGDVPALMPIARGRKNSGGSWFTQGNGATVTRNDPRDEGQKKGDGVKVALSGRAWFTEGLGKVSSASSARKMASAQIAKIPFPLAEHIAQIYRSESL